MRKIVAIVDSIKQPGIVMLKPGENMTIAII